jgi:hypothetical protein
VQASRASDGSRRAKKERAWECSSLALFDL